MVMKNYRQELKDRGIDIDGLKGVLAKDSVVLDADTGLPTGVTAANVSIPVELLTYFDPRVIEILWAPRNATKLFSEIVIGDWTMESRKYQLSEICGSVAPYGDFSDNGEADINVNFIPQDIFRFQTTIKYGDLEAAKAAIAKVMLIAGKQKSANALLSIMANKIYMYGISGLNIFGILNHPLLPASLTPTTGNSTGATDWVDKTADEIYEDFVKTIADIIKKSGGLVTANDRFITGLSNNLVPYLNKQNMYGISVLDMVKKNYPSLEFVSVPEFQVEAGEYMYIHAVEVMGQPTGECVSTQKLRMFPVIPGLSSYRQKAAAASLGFSLYMPFALSRMLVG
jgi:Uncharacterized protein conserved in bacteria (DUF2184).